jgi:NAD(P)-dependent dehydrogenase (short-subunit alcohol dehydrogenase family)
MVKMIATEEKEEVIVVTGGTSGIGFEASKCLSKTQKRRVVLIGRSQATVNKAIEAIKTQETVLCEVEGHVTDISSLSEVRSLANYIFSKKWKIYTLVCNAGVEAPPVPYSPEGFETTFATNHLGHFLLVTSLYHANCFVSVKYSRLVIVTSALHNPEDRSSSSAPDVSDWYRVAYGGEGWASRRAYATSKLCNLFFGYEFMRKYPNGPTVYMYSPGFVPDTGLFRNHSSIGWFIVKSLIKLVSYWKTEMRISTAERSGAFLSRLASDPDLPWESGSYFSIDQLFHPSEQSKDPLLAATLWEKSLEWIDKR